MIIFNALYYQFVVLSMVSIEIILIFLCQLFGSYSYKVIKSSFNFKLRPFYGNIEEKAFNKNQLEFMHKDECIAVDWNDNMIGYMI